MSSVSEPFVEYMQANGSIKLRDPTNKELAESELRRTTLNLLRERLKTLKAEIKELESGCPHTVSIDTAGFPYDVRRCHACGAHQGLI